MPKYDSAFQKVRELRIVRENNTAELATSNVNEAKTHSDAHTGTWNAKPIRRLATGIERFSKWEKKSINSCEHCIFAAFFCGVWMSISKADDFTIG